MLPARISGAAAASSLPCSSRAASRMNSSASRVHRPLARRAASCTGSSHEKSQRSVRYDLKGVSVMNEGGMGGQSETVARWDGDRLVVTWTTEGAVAGTKNVRIETRSLSPDGATMTVESIRGTSKPMVMVFDRVR